MPGLWTCEDVREVLERQIDYNWAIAEEGDPGEITEPISEASFGYGRRKRPCPGKGYGGGGV